ncbi:16S rRNA (guanine(966)-N(2))-methyltransferase RsmD [Roseisolibacter sp. H3M3-2]|uniref:16S rRNA (guanine(966)-N(2))-methyltransferase RsmD n=1 Tax=Roseisolibacter sp. H3M3-2 TaxID=3031323 RepID=UPI0023DBEFDF|nr:16S rRNA (guanine(966)-N(2))-methyltransferase RsmD [Roseisolibacter sp. H3M3-2]MDF1502192.1 16S rRNA (guanine(966)-N(2))-methyltransferase RsmD [Roseisolibacter sp. H3M3-2]
MRIVAGRWRGRTIDAPKDARVRPTADRVREAWLSIVAADVDGARVLDLFAGSGALGLEALSRGAASADFVELNPPSLRALGANIARLGADAQAHVRRGDALRFVDALEADAYDLAFADPPYAHDAALRVAERWLVVPFARVLGVEHSSRVTLPAGGDTRTYGDTAVTIYRVPD